MLYMSMVIAVVLRTDMKIIIVITYPGETFWKSKCKYKHAN